MQVGKLSSTTCVLSMRPLLEHTHVAPMSGSRKVGGGPDEYIVAHLKVLLDQPLSRAVPA